MIYWIMGGVLVLIIILYGAARDNAGSMPPKDDPYWKDKD